RPQVGAGDRGVAWLAPAVLITPVAALFKENGALLPVLLLLVETILFRLRTASPDTRRSLLRFHALFTLLPVLLGALALAFMMPRLLEGYAVRDFNVVERALTQARVVFQYAQMILLPDVRQMGLFHDHLAVSRGLLSPPTTLPALLAGIGAVVLAWRVRQ